MTAMADQEWVGRVVSGPTSSIVGVHIAGLPRAYPEVGAEVVITRVVCQHNNRCWYKRLWENEQQAPFQYGWSCPTPDTGQGCGASAGGMFVNAALHAGMPPRLADG